MFGDERARVLAMRPFGLHGLTYWDVSVEYEDGRTEDARLGPEGVPAGIEVGDDVMVKRAAMIVIGIEPITQ